MKTLIVILLLFTFQPAFSQEWRDSLMEARRLYRNGEYEKSISYYESAQRLAPENVDLSQEEGLSAFRAKKYPEAEKLFNRAAARQKDPKKRSAAYNNEGYARMQQQNYAGAEESFKNALRANPANEKARQNLAEAKRIRKKKDEQEKQNQNQNQDQNQKQKQQQQQQNEKQQNKGNQQNQQNSSQGQNGKPQPPKGGNSGQPDDKQKNGAPAQPKLSDKQTDRKLDELMRQEMGTQKRLDGTKKGGNGTAVRKDW